MSREAPAAPSRRVLPPGVPRQEATLVPSVEALLASTAKLLSQSSALDSGLSKESSLSRLTASSSQDFVGKSAHPGNSNEGGLGAPASQQSSDGRTDAGEGAEGTSPRGSPLIRARHSQPFTPEASTEETRVGDPANEEQAVAIPTEGRQRRRPAEVHRGLKELRHSLRAMRDNLAAQPAGRAPAPTRIPKPRPRSKPVFEIAAGPSKPDIGIASAFDTDYTQAEWQQPIKRTSDHGVQLERAASGSRRLDHGSLKPDEAKKAVSALFDSLWDTDDESQLSSVLQHDRSRATTDELPAHQKASRQLSTERPAGGSRPETLDNVWNKISETRDGSAAIVPTEAIMPSQQAEVVKPRKGTHKKSAESGTLNRKMRGLEAVWQQLERERSVKSAGAEEAACRRALEASIHSSPPVPQLKLASMPLLPEPGSDPSPEDGQEADAPEAGLSAVHDTKVTTIAAAISPIMEDPVHEAGTLPPIGTPEADDGPHEASAAPRAADPAALPREEDACAKAAASADSAKAVGSSAHPDVDSVPTETTAHEIVEVPQSTSADCSRDGSTTVSCASSPAGKPKKPSRLKFWKFGKSRKAAQKEAAGVQRLQSAMVAPSASESSPEKPPKRQDSFTKLAGLFRRRSLPGSPQPTAAPQQPSNVQQTGRNAAAVDASPPAQPSPPSPPVEPRASEASSSRDLYTPGPANKAFRAEKRIDATDREDSAQGWIGNDEAVKQLLVPHWVPSAVGVPVPTSRWNLHATESAEARDGPRRVPEYLQEGLQGAEIPARNVAGMRLGRVASQEASPLQRQDGGSLTNGMATHADDSSCCEADGANSEGWLTPERAVKNLLVPTWVPSKLPFRAPAPAPDGGNQAEQTPSVAGLEKEEDLIAAVSPRHTGSVSKQRAEWSGSKVPFSDVAMPSSSMNLSTHRSLHSRPSTVPEDDSWRAAETDSPVAEASGSSLHSTNTMPAPRALPVPKPSQTVTSLPPVCDGEPSLLAHREGLKRLRLEPQSSSAKAKAGFFRSLFRRRSENGGGVRTRQAAEAARRVSDGGALPAACYQQHPRVAPPLLSARASGTEKALAVASRPFAPPLSMARPDVEPREAVQAADAEEDLEAKPGDTATEDRGESSAGPKRESWEGEFSFCVPPATLAGHSSAVERDRTPSTGRRRVTDEDLGNLERNFKTLEDTYERLPVRAMSRERQREVPPPKLPQMDVFERAAGNPRPRPLSATGRAEAVPFMMQRIPSPASDRRATRGFRQTEAVPFEPAALTNSRWCESLRSPERRPATAARRTSTAKAAPVGPSSAEVGRGREAGKDRRAVSPFGRVRCDPERAVPFLTKLECPDDGLVEPEEDTPQNDSPVSRIEKQLKSSAGADEGSGSPQWRLIAERAVKGPAVSAQSTGTPSNAAGQGSPTRRETSESISPTHTGASSPGAKARSEPIIVDSNRPAFPALKAYLGAKSPQRSPARNLADDPEIAACRGVSVLQQRFEGGRLVASNVAALQRHFNDPSNTRERTAAWASEHATMKVPSPPVRSRGGAINLTATSHDYRQRPHK